MSPSASDPARCRPPPASAVDSIRAAGDRLGTRGHGESKMHHSALYRSPSCEWVIRRHTRRGRQVVDGLRRLPRVMEVEGDVVEASWNSKPQAVEALTLGSVEAQKFHKRDFGGA